MLKAVSGKYPRIGLMENSWKLPSASFSLQEAGIAMLILKGNGAMAQCQSVSLLMDVAEGWVKGA